MKTLYIILFLLAAALTGVQAQTVSLVSGTKVADGGIVYQGTKVAAMSKTERDNLVKAPALTGVMIFNTTDGCQEYWDGEKWVRTGGQEWFYMPSIVLPTDPASLSWGTYDAATQVFTIDLYADVYAKQFGMADATTSYKSAGAGTLQLKTAAELEYFIVYYDKDAFTIQSLDANGVLKYKADPARVTEKTFMNIVFKVK